MITQDNFIEELKNKNEEALEYVLDTYGNLIYKISYMHLNSPELSKECVNETLLKIWISIENFKYSDDKFKNWIGAIAKHTAIDMFRKEAKYKSSSEFNDSYKYNEKLMSDDIIAKEELEEIRENINMFNEIDKYIFINRFFIGKSVNLIAKELNLTPNAVSLRISKGRSKLKNLIV